MIETAKANGLDPYRYLLYVFAEARFLAQKNERWMEAFLPIAVPDFCKATAEEQTEE